MEPCRQRGMSSFLRCRLIGRRFNSPIMVVGFVCFVFFSLSLFTCCTVDRADAGLDPSLRHRRHHTLRTQVAGDDELRYQRDLGTQGENIISHLRRKTLLEETVSTNAKTRVDPVVVDTYADETSDTEDDSPDAYDDMYEGHTHRKGRGRRRYPGGDDAGADQNGTKRLPVAVIIGVKKGGTRAMLEFLRVHPDVRAPGPETHFFDKNYHLGLEWYRQQMPPTLDGQITIEKTPSYFVTKGVPGRIFNMSKGIKLIVVVRDPVIRAVSDYTQVLSKRSSMKSFEQMAFLDNSTRVVDTSWSAIKIGVYARHLERWLQYFPMEQIHFASGEKLIENPATEMAKVQDFLGLKRLVTDKHFYFNTTKGFPCLKKTEEGRNPHCLGKTKGRTHPEVNPQVERRLRDFFRPFNQKFYQMTGIDFGWS